MTHLYFRFRTIFWVNVSGFSPNLVCALVLWSSGFGLLMANFHQFLTKLSAHDKSDFSFLDSNLSKYQGIFTKLGLCIDIVEVWFGIANGQISSARDTSIFSSQDNQLTWVNLSRFSPNWKCALILWRPGLGLHLDTLVSFWLSYLPMIQ